MLTIKNIDLLDEQADALIYSTNVLLNCSGGVGSGLVSRYGQNIQDDLHRILEKRGTRFVERGEIFQHVSAGMPYELVFHTIPSNGWYETTPDIIEAIIIKCLHQCDEHDSVNKVVMSVLATGYGKLPYDEFFRILNHVITNNTFLSLSEIMIPIIDPYAFDLASKQIQNEALNIAIHSTDKTVTAPLNP